MAAAGAAALMFILPATAEADWGAISINEDTGRTSISYDYDTAAGAKLRSQSECGRGCHVAVWVEDGYAFLVKKTNGRFKAGLAKTARGALRMARRRAGEPKAPVQAWVFSGY